MYYLADRHLETILYLLHRNAIRNLRKDSSWEVWKEIPVERALENGHVTVWLNGKKLKRGYSLTRVEKGEKERWLLVKMKDDEADARRNPVSTEPDSALSGRSLEEIGGKG